MFMKRIIWVFDGLGWLRDKVGDERNLDLKLKCEINLVL